MLSLPRNLTSRASPCFLSGVELLNVWQLFRTHGLLKNEKSRGVKLSINHFSSCQVVGIERLETILHNSPQFIARAAQISSHQILPLSERRTSINLRRNTYVVYMRMMNLGIGRVGWRNRMELLLATFPIRERIFSLERCPFSHPPNVPHHHRSHLRSPH